MKMRDLSLKELNSVFGAGINKDAAVAAGSAAGGLPGKGSRIPGADIIGGALGGYIGGVIADGSNQSITIPSINISTSPSIGLGCYNPNYNSGLIGSGFGPATSSASNGC
ncbi:hypothetical protein QFI91_01965 [Raoultella sp. WB_B2P2-3]|uniref:hypothetical protein n=1 Tax=Raoultella scottii TaxID=3040937 RepID=UPI002F933E71